MEINPVLLQSHDPGIVLSATVYDISALLTKRIHSSLTLKTLIYALIDYNGKITSGYPWSH